MKTRVGLWIDHRKAVVVALTEKGGEMGLVLSRVERQLRRTGDSPLRGRCEPESVPAEDVRQKMFTGHLNMYYGAVAASLRDAGSIYIFGPGEAKLELKKHLKKINMGDRIMGMESADKMTDRQIAAKVRQYFAEQEPIRKPR